MSRLYASVAVAMTVALVACGATEPTQPIKATESPQRTNQFCWNIGSDEYKIAGFQPHPIRRNPAHEHVCTADELSKSSVPTVVLMSHRHHQSFKHCDFTGRPVPRHCYVVLPPPTPTTTVFEPGQSPIPQI